MTDKPTPDEYAEAAQYLFAAPRYAKANRYVDRYHRYRDRAKTYQAKAGKRATDKLRTAAALLGAPYPEEKTNG